MLAWSGGLDSTVLLHLLLQARSLDPQLKLRAVHIDHGLQPAAADFRNFCRSMARQWRLPLSVIRVQLRARPGDSVEEAAREARYQALGDSLRPAEWLLTAQHADDQLETVLLAWLRGAGPAGLAAMPWVAPPGIARLMRPLLDVERAQLVAHATRNGLRWQEDPSNAQPRFDRNYLRSQVLPALRQRWPAVARTAGRSARHCAVAASMVARSARQDLEAAADGPDLEIAVLRRWSPARTAAVLRLWIADHGQRTPESRHMEQIAALMSARIDAQPLLQLPHLAIRRHAGRLVLQVRTAPRATSARVHRWSWRRGALQLDGGELRIVSDPHGDLDLARLPQRLLVQHPAASGGKRLRKLMQELAIPEWRRAQLPLLVAAGRNARPLAVADLWLARELRSTDGSIRRGRIFWRELR